MRCPREDCPDCKQLRGKPLPGRKVRKAETPEEESDGDEGDSVFDYCAEQVQSVETEVASVCLEGDFLCVSVSPPVGSIETGGPRKEGVNPCWRRPQWY